MSDDEVMGGSVEYEQLPFLHSSTVQVEEFRDVTWTYLLYKHTYVSDTYLLYKQTLNSHTEV